MVKWVILILVTLPLLSCVDGKVYPGAPIPLIEADHQSPISSPAGNLMATAIKEVNNLDIVFYPRPFIGKHKVAILNPEKLDQLALQQILDLYADAPQDRFLVGLMSGKNIKDFVKARSEELYQLELEVAGMAYHIHYVGGVPQYAYFSNEQGQPIEDKKLYRIALSNYFYFSGTTFPSYKYRNSVGFSFAQEDRLISAKNSLREFLTQKLPIPYLSKVRAKVSTYTLPDVGYKSIPQIQGAQHRSPLVGHRVTTEGIVTAVNISQWYPGGIDMYIQSRWPDALDETSEGLNVHFRDESLRFQLGDYIKVTGTVYERLGSEQLGNTGLREITNFKIISHNNKLPEPVVLGLGGRMIPNHSISTYRGDLNLKPYLKLSDGIDFWESLEGMRVQIHNPRVVGFRGGQEEFESTKPKSYLNLYVVADGHIDISDQATAKGGIIVDLPNKDLNPEIIQIVSNHLTFPFDSSTVFNVGDLLDSTLVGVLGYEKNIFGNGEYSFMLPREEEAEALTKFIKNKKTSLVPLPDKGVTRLEPTTDHLTIATFNLENLAGNQPNRIHEFAKAIQINLRCPDILTLVEIQDDNGLDFLNGSTAAYTLKKLISMIICPGSNYQAINIDPVTHSEGGQPGGNIRVAFLYNAQRVGFQPRGNGDALSETRVDDQGNLTHNPGRVFPNSKAFKHTRRSLVAQFLFKGEKVFVIGNHFNSKLSDASYWSATQPPKLESDSHRILLADGINQFVQLIERRSPGARIAVAGDFNALLSESSIKVLEGEHLTDLLRFIDPRNRYTTNYNGNSQLLDHILVNNSLMQQSPEIEILNINSDFMGRLSDHDPVISRFRF